MRPYLTHFFTCSEDSAKWLFGSKLAKEAIFQPNAIDAANFEYHQTKYINIREREGWDNKFIIGNVARFDKQKNHLFLLEVVNELIKKRQDVLCVLVGSKNGEEYEKVEQRIKELKLDSYVKFYGTRSDIPELMQGMDILLFPSLHEGLSVTMIEAQASGLKIYTSTGVSKQVAIIPELVDFLRLDSGAEDWASYILQHTYKRESTIIKIKNAGFDIKENAVWLSNIYLSHINNNLKDKEI